MSALACPPPTPPVNGRGEIVGRLGLRWATMIEGFAWHEFVAGQIAVVVPGAGGLFGRGGAVLVAGGGGRHGAPYGVLIRRAPRNGADTISLALPERSLATGFDQVLPC